MHKETHSGKMFWLEMVKIIVLLECTSKFLQLIRYRESFCFLVEMLVQVFNDMYPFLVIFFTFTGIFVIITDILEGGYSADDYGK